MHVVTISATYGAAGSVVGPAVAERLGVPFVDRAIPTAVADRLDISLDEAMDRDEQVQSRLTRWMAPVSSAWLAGPVPPPTALLTDGQVLACTQDAIRRCVGERGGVILGRAGAIVLRDHPSALHVRLDGDPERRVRQAMGILGITEQEARDGMARNDQARVTYVRHFYRTDPARCDLYHLVLDSTYFPPAVCADLIAAAANATRPADAGRTG